MRAFFPRFLVLPGIILLGVMVHSHEAPAEPLPPDDVGESRYYAGGLAANRYSSLDQINAGNLPSLKIAWRHPGVDPHVKIELPSLSVSNNFRSTPIMVDGVLFTSNAIGLAEAIDPGTGKTLWTEAELQA